MVPARTSEDISRAPEHAASCERHERPARRRERSERTQVPGLMTSGSQRTLER